LKLNLPSKETESRTIDGFDGLENLPLTTFLESSFKADPIGLNMVAVAPFMNRLMDLAIHKSVAQSQ